MAFDEWKDLNYDGSLDLSVEFVRGSGMGGGIGSILYSDRQEPDGEGFETVREYFVYSPAVGHTVATLVDKANPVKSTNLYEAFGNVVKLNGTTWEQTNGTTSGGSENNRLGIPGTPTAIGLDAPSTVAWAVLGTATINTRAA